MANYLERNAASRQRLRAVVARATGDQLSAEARLRTATLLAHLTFWDRFVQARWRLAADQQLDAPPEIADANTQLVNDAGFPQWRTIPLEVAARDALHVADELDRVIGGISPEAADRLIAAGRERLIDRSLHRNEHLDDLEGPSRQEIP